jgi:ribonucleoside-diphosphate reductase alpha chain
MKNDSGVLPPMEPQALCTHVFKEKYAAPGEVAHLQVQQRVAHALATDAEQEKRFLQAQLDGFIAGGRINSAAGLDRVSTLINCFVQPIEDTMSGYAPNGLPGIMTALAEASETMRRGGGVGYDFSKLRPLRAKVKGTHSTASGPVSYMRVFDRACDTVESAGARRGAQMGVMRVDHPDVELFIDAKKTPDFKKLGLDESQEQSLMRMIAANADFGWSMRKAFASLSNFNISVGVTDRFMEAVIADEEFALVHEAEPEFSAEKVVCDDGVERYVYRTVSARALWNKIMRNTYETADPGVLFLDTINRMNNLRYCEKIAASNPCGEQLLPAYGCCDLGSPNLTRFVEAPFTPQARFNYAAFRRVVGNGVEFLDNVLDATKWPLKQQQAEAESKRRVGIGFLGLGDAMVMLGLVYGSTESAEFAATVSREMRDAAYEASVELAKIRGAFPLFDAEQYLAEGTFASTLPKHIQDGIRKHGIRNSHLLSIAPTGTIALAFADNASSGIEPIFDLVTYRNVRTGKGEERTTWKAYDHAVRVWLTMNGLADYDGSLRELPNLPAAFVTAQDLTVADHLRVMEAVAPYIDSAISKTVNVPADYAFEDFEAIYVDAWKRGLKGITTYRPNPMVGSVLVSQDAHEKAQQRELRDDDPDRRVEIKDVPSVVERLRWPSRPDVVAEGVTYSVRHPQGNFAVVVNHWMNGAPHPLEVYIAGNEAPRGLAAIAKGLSVDMRTDDSAFLAMKLESLLNTKGDDGFEMVHPATGNRVFMPSLTAGFAALVKHRLAELGILGDEHAARSPILDALFSKREPKTSAEGAIGWHVDINNPATGDDLLLHTKELKLPDGTIRPYSVWLSGHYPKVLDGLMKVLSIDMRISDPDWVVEAAQADHVRRSARGFPRAGPGRSQAAELPEHGGVHRNCPARAHAQAGPGA